jgi:hypothetical protein
MSSDQSSIKLHNRSAFTIPFETRLQNAKDVYVLGITLSGILAHYFSYIITRANSGCKFHFLILDPNYIYATGENPKPWTGITRRQIFTQQSVRQLAMIKEQTSNVEVGFVPNPPPFSLLIIDPKQPYGEIQVELQSYDVSESDQPHFVIANSDHSDWYDFFITQFEYAVKRSRPITSKDTLRAKKL